MGGGVRNLWGEWAPEAWGGGGKAGTKGPREQGTREQKSGAREAVIRG
jgi:hypothetical protein